MTLKLGYVYNIICQEVKFLLELVIWNLFYSIKNFLNKTANVSGLFGEPLFNLLTKYCSQLM